MCICTAIFFYTLHKGPFDAHFILIFSNSIFFQCFSFHIHFTHVFSHHYFSAIFVIQFGFCFSILNPRCFFSVRGACYRFVIVVTISHRETCVFVQHWFRDVKKASCRDIAGLYTGFVLLSLFCTYYMLLHVISLCSYCTILMLRHLDSNKYCQSVHKRVIITAKNH